MTLLTGAAVVPQDFDIELDSGRLRVRRHGSPRAPLVLCLPGLSANLVSFDFLGERLGGSDVQLVAVDLRGRGRSEITAPGTYGWVNHARDVPAIADRLGADRFTLVGHSMGAAVAMVAAWLDASRLERVALIDLCGAPEPASLVPIAASVNRLGVVYPSVETYLELIRGMGAIDPWNEYWERYFRYELEERDGGVATRTDRAAIWEDAAFGAGAYAFGEESGIYALWAALTMPALLVCAAREVLPGYGHLVSARDRDRFAQRVRGSTVVEVDANHYTAVADDGTLTAVRRFIGAGA